MPTIISCRTFCKIGHLETLDDKFPNLLPNMTIFQTIQYITENKVMETESRELAAVSRGKIRAGETDDWKSEQLFVPPLPPTNLRGCHMIRIQYDVFVSITISPPPLTQLIIAAAPSSHLKSFQSIVQTF